MSHKSGWRSTAMRKGKQAELPIVAAVWDTLLEGRGWTLAEAIRSAEAREIAKNKLLNRRYIPQVVLDAWGWTERV